jgi:hypothetical protein
MAKAKKAGKAKRVSRAKLKRLIQEVRDSFSKLEDPLANLFAGNYSKEERKVVGAFLKLKAKVKGTQPAAKRAHGNAKVSKRKAA